MTRCPGGGHCDVSRRTLRGVQVSRWMDTVEVSRRTLGWLVTTLVTLVMNVVTTVVMTVVTTVVSALGRCRLVILRVDAAQGNGGGGVITRLRTFHAALKNWRGPLT